MPPFFKKFNYCDDMTKMDKGVLVCVMLDADKRTIAFKINDKQYETKSIGVIINKYKLIVTIMNKNHEIELL